MKFPGSLKLGSVVYFMPVIDVKKFDNWSAALGDTDLTSISHFVWKNTEIFKHIGGVDAQLNTSTAEILTPAYPAEDISVSVLL